MPSTLVHLAFAGLLASALLGEAFDKKSLAIVFIVVALADLDSFIPYAGATGHRIVLHNIWIPLIGLAILGFVVHYRSGAYLPDSWTGWEVRVAWVALVCYLLAHVMLDLVDGSVTLLWPLSDQFYTLDGSIELSDREGLVQTFSDGGIPLLEARGSTDEVRITTGVDPGPRVDGERPERLFPIVRAGWELWLLVVGTIVTVARFLLPHSVEDA